MAGSSSLRGKKQHLTSSSSTERTTTHNNNKRPRNKTLLDLAWKSSSNQEAEDDDEHIHSSSDDDDDYDQQQRYAESEEDEEEAVDVKRVRLAREYLQQVEARSDESSSDEEEEESDDDDNAADVLGRKLQRDRLKRAGTLQRALAKQVFKHVTALQQAMVEARPALLDPTVRAQEWIEHGHVRLWRGHDLTPTCVAIDSSGKRAVSGSKDHSVLVWNIEQQEQQQPSGSSNNNNNNNTTPLLATLCPHWKKQQQQQHGSGNEQQHLSRADGQVLAVAMSDDGRFTAVGKRNGKVSVFDTSSPASIMSKNNSPNNKQQQPLLLKTLTGHKGPVTCLTFGGGTATAQSNTQLFTASDDRCIRHYNLAEADNILYMDTLYGHQFGVTAMDCISHLACNNNKPVSVGRDRTARVWKLDEDTHLIYRGGSKLPSAECVVMIKDNWFVTGHEDGHVCLWMTEKKKAVSAISTAHGADNPVVSIACCKGSDVVATGSKDGFLRFWKVSTGQTLQERGMEPLCAVPITGYINAIAMGPKAKFCVLAVGQEHRSGRWDRVRGAKNRIAIVNLYSSELVGEEEEEEEDGDNEASRGDDAGMDVKQPSKEEASSSSEEEESSDSDS